MSRLEKEGKPFVIRPSQAIEIGRIEKNPEKLQSVYELGISDTQIIFPKLTEFLNNTK